MCLESGINVVIDIGTHFDDIEEMTKFYTSKRGLFIFKDPVHMFLLALLVDFNFGEASKKISESIEAIKEDENLVNRLDQFIENARRVFLNRYFLIYEVVLIKSVAKELQMPVKEVTILIEDLMIQNELPGQFNEDKTKVYTYMK
ncbi:hypothetical protein ACOME3_000123 [Neoechinorhynchus agilis]